jgi:hypothetical protein
VVQGRFCIELDQSTERLRRSGMQNKKARADARAFFMNKVNAYLFGRR